MPNDKHRPVTRHEIDRIIIGNQIAIMRALGLQHPHNSVRHALDVRIVDVKAWWRQRFGEEVGFQTAFGDEPPREG